MKGSFPARMALGTCVVAAVLSLWLRTGIPLFAIGGSSLDDALFLKLAHSLVAGHWLGSFDNTTLAKGMFYPLFAALAFVANIPLKVAEQAVYLAVSGWLAAFAARQSGRPALCAGLFVALAFNPLLWLPFMARVVREGLYISLSLLVVGLLAATLFDDRARACARLRVLLAGLTGLVAGCFWLTREEGPWIVPALVTLLLVRVVNDLGEPPPTQAAHWRTRPWPALAITVVLPALAVFSITLGVVKTANLHRFGVFETNEFHSHSFQRGYGALSRIRPQQWQRYTVFPRDARQKAYAHSGAARELAPFFEGPGGRHWAVIGCTQMGLSPCSEIHSGWFMWALRDAVAQAGHYRSAPQALAFYERLADEIDAACDSGKVDCLPPRASLAPPFRWHYLKDLAAPGLELARFVFRMGEGAASAVPPSSGTPAELDFFRQMTGSEPSPPLQVAGWVASRAPLEEIALYDLAGRPANRSIERSPAIDVAQAWPGFQANRFSIATRCAPQDCVLRVRTADGGIDLPLRRGDLLQRPGLKVHVDSLAGQAGGGITEARRHVQERIMRAIAAAYATAFPVLAVLAAAGLLLSMSRPAMRRSVPGCIGLAAACLVGVLTRIGLLAYLDVTSIPSANGSYATPASPLLVVFVVLGLWLGIQSLSSGAGAQRNTAA